VRTAAVCPGAAGQGGAGLYTVWCAAARRSALPRTHLREEPALRPAAGSSGSCIATAVAAALSARSPRQASHGRLGRRCTAPIEAAGARSGDSHATALLLLLLLLPPPPPPRPPRPLLPPRPPRPLLPPRVPPPLPPPPAHGSSAVAGAASISPQRQLCEEAIKAGRRGSPNARPNDTRVA
jgi:hypothetical protein